MANTSAILAKDVVVRFTDGGTVIGTSAPVDIAAGATTSVSVDWDTRGVKGDRIVTATVDPANAIAESNEADNAITRLIKVRGNKVTNGSYEESADRTHPDGWSTGGARYDSSGTHASDGTDAIGLPGGLLTAASVTSAPIPVDGGATYSFAGSVVSGKAPAVSVTFLDATGAAVGSVVKPATTLFDEAGTDVATGKLTVPAGATQVRLTLAAPTSLTGGETTWLDDVWLW